MNVDMAITHTNRKGDTYHLTRWKGKGSRTQYVFSKKDLCGEAVDSIPDGYEVFEHPNGQVFLHRQIISEVPDADYRVIEQYTRGHFRDELYILERKRREVVIHFADQRNTGTPDTSSGTHLLVEASEVRTCFCYVGTDSNQPPQLVAKRLSCP